MVQIAPSLLSANFSILRKEVEALDRAGADFIHFDVMDGHFVPNLTFGPMVVKSLRAYTKIPFDVHLMVSNPEDFIKAFAEVGADILTVHAEASLHLDKLLSSIRDLGVKAGVAINPATNENVIQYVLDKTDLILVMSVNPGFGGQTFIPSSIDKISRIRKMIKGKDILLEVDGGINPMTAAECISAGADLLVAGTSVFKGGEYQKNIEALR